ncbi:MAG: hypothetical protein HY400_00865, partial [Elusimicrobia bacterium]|nr:hypothetical protein [Elusimicrobiota bacterium]
MLVLFFLSEPGWANDELEHEGSLVVMIENHRDRSIAHYYLHTLRGEVLEIIFPNTEKIPHLLSGSKVRVRGKRSAGKDNQILLPGDGSGSFEVISSASIPAPTGEQNVIMLLLNFKDFKAEPYTIDYASSVLFGTTNRFYQEASYNQTWFSGDIFGWFTMQISVNDPCNYSAIALEASKAAASAGIDFTKYSRRVYAFPKNTCPWWGLGTVGGSPSSAWINGSLVLRILGHELGHNLGLWHARFLDCGSTPYDPTETSCTRSEYGDPYDIMGAMSSPPYHFNAKFKEVLTWMTVQAVTESGTYEIAPIELPGNVPRGLKISSQYAGKNYTYYLEYRQASGFDGTISDPTVLNGLLVHLGTNPTDAIDMTPETSSWMDAGLQVGKTYADPGLGFTITPVSKSTSSIHVRVQFTSDPMPPAKPKGLV